jgi:proteasome assembly chaperone (PAC2) family protein
MISLLLPVSDWLIIMIGSGGLLLVISHLFAVPVLVLMGWVLGEKKVNNQTWM